MNIMRFFISAFFVAALSLQGAIPVAAGQTPAPPARDHRPDEAETEALLKKNEAQIKEYEAERRKKAAQKRLNQTRESIQAARVGDTYFDAGHYQRAVDYYQRAVSLSEENAHAHMRLLEAARLRNESEIDIHPRYHRAMEYIRQGIYEKAVDELVALIQENPNHPLFRKTLTTLEAAMQTGRHPIFERQ
jgi:tetratricopeptide (TPR) repeat protein